MASNDEDTNVYDSWEDIDETEIIEQKFKSILSQAQDTNSMDSKCCKPVNVILLGEDALRSQYVPPEPKVQILKRPSKDAGSLNGYCKPRPQFKTLKQREQEYAEARLRILGEAHSQEERVCSIENKCQMTTTPVLVSSSTSVLRLPRGPDGTKGFHARR